LSNFRFLFRVGKVYEGKWGDYFIFADEKFRTLNIEKGGLTAKKKSPKWIITYKKNFYFRGGRDD